MKKNILVTNDDGIYGMGLRPLISELEKLGTVTAVVPDQERSGASHSITLHKPFRIHETEPGLYLTNGTPADCVKYGVRSLLKGKVDLIVSGINSGPNLGNDVVYSGTVAGAREGAMLGYSSFAVSVAELANGDFIQAAKVSARIAAHLLHEKCPLPKIYLNINVPRVVKGMMLTAVGTRIYDENVECRTDPRGKKYYWLAGKFVSGEHHEGTDITAVDHGFVSITPLHLDPTAYDEFARLDYLLHDDIKEHGDK
ncbi:MAG: 5'/3'-nucleotidase SurE [Endomicrobiales bacterium]|jgi:5'-nucleotidase